MYLPFHPFYGICEKWAKISKDKNKFKLRVIEETNPEQELHKLEYLILKQQTELIYQELKEAINKLSFLITLLARTS